MGMKRRIVAMRMRTFAGRNGAIKRMSRKPAPTRNWRAKEMERRPN
jgi:hypothetical protein